MSMSSYTSVVSDPLVVITSRDLRTLRNVQAEVLKKLTRWTKLEEVLTPPQADVDDDDAKDKVSTLHSLHVASVNSCSVSAGSFQHVPINRMHASRWWSAGRNSWSKTVTTMHHVSQPEAAMTVEEKEAAKRQLFNPREAFQMLSKELMDIMHGAEPWLEADAVGDDVYKW
jgi:hypothetical protein